MKLRSAALVVALAAAVSAAVAQVPATAPATAPSATKPSAFKTDQERYSYALGLQLGDNLHGAQIDMDAFAKGIKDAGPMGKSQLSDDELDDSLMALKKEVMAKGDAEAKMLTEKNLKEGAAFLAENAKKDGVKITASGLQYKSLKAGKGKSPKATDTVAVNYRGTFVDGTQFDASKPGEPATFPVNEIIPGWTEALQLMKEGDKWQIVIPSKLAYGEEGQRGIAPNSVLVFEVELVEVKAAPDAPKGGGIQSIPGLDGLNK